MALLDPTSVIGSYGYAALFALAFLQSCAFPTSSELSMGIAGVLAYQGHLSLAGAIGTGVAGEVAGAYLAWWVGRAGGRPVVARFGRYVLVSTRDVDRAEAWFERRRRWGVLVSRLIPVVRGVAGYAAGMARVPAARFGALTIAGSAIWDGAFALLGYALGPTWTRVEHGVSVVGIAVGAAVVVLLAVGVAHRWRSYRADLRATSGTEAEGPA